MKCLGLIACMSLSAVAYAAGAPNLPLPVICDSTDQDCSVDKDLLWNCDELGDAVSVGLYQTDSGAIAGNLGAGGKIDGVFSTLNCSTQKNSTIICQSDAPGTFRTVTGPVDGPKVEGEVTASFTVTLSMIKSEMVASIEGLYTVRDALNWPLNFPVLQDKPIQAKCLSRKQTIKEKMNPQICTSTDGKRGKVLTYFSSGYQFYNVVGQLSKAAGSVSCSAQMISAAADHTNFWVQKTAQCPLDWARIYQNGVVKMGCESNACRDQSFACVDQ